MVLELIPTMNLQISMHFRACKCMEICRFVDVISSQTMGWQYMCVCVCLRVCDSKSASTHCSTRAAGVCLSVCVCRRYIHLVRSYRLRYSQMLSDTNANTHTRTHTHTRTRTHAHESAEFHVRCSDVLSDVESHAHKSTHTYKNTHAFSLTHTYPRT